MEEPRIYLAVGRSKASTVQQRSGLIVIDMRSDTVEAVTWKLTYGLVLVANER